MGDITLTTPHGDMRGYLAVPAGSGPWPAIVVIHEITGLNADIRAHADRLATRGYLALAPDLYSWGRTWQCVRAAFGDLRAGQGRAFDDIDAARAWLVARDDCAGKVGVIGFCMGGGFALLAAPRYAFAAASVNYGQTPKDAEAVLAGACPIVGSYGGRDWALRGHAARLDHALSVLNVPHDVKEYPRAGHSFLNHHSGLPFTVLSVVLGMGYHGPSAADALSRIDAFFNAHLR